MRFPQINDREDMLTWEKVPNGFSVKKFSILLERSLLSEERRVRVDFSN